MGAPIVLVFTRRLSNGYVLSVEEPFTVERTGDEQRDLVNATSRIVEVFERQIRENPEQWVMFQRVWPETRPDVELRSPVDDVLDATAPMLETEQAQTMAASASLGSASDSAAAMEHPVRPTPD